MGAAVSAHALAHALPGGDRADGAFLLAWWLGLCAMAVLGAPHQAPRYLFPAFFPLAALLVRVGEGVRSPGQARALAWGTAASLFLQLAVGLVLVGSDNLFAASSERCARELAADPRLRDRELLFVGHWGFQFHAERAGMRHVSTDEPVPASGTVVAVVLDTVPSEFPSWLARHRPEGHALDTENFRLIETRSYPHPWPLQTIGFERRALLYAPSHRLRFLPYTRSSGRAFRVAILERI